MRLTPIPDLEMPPQLRKAAEVRQARAADLTAAQEALRAARVAVETAIVEDRAAYASARDAGQDDPGPVREEAARAEVAACERRERGEALRLARAEEQLGAATGEHVDGWAERVARLWAKQDSDVLRALGKLEEAEAKRSETRAVANWLAQVQQSGDLAARVRQVSDETSLGDARSAGAHLRVAQLLDALREHVETTCAESYAEGAAARAEARERDQRLAALRTHERLEARVAATHVDGGSFTIEEAELVAEGAPLDEVEQLAAQRRAEERPAPVGWG
jgi:hypothetical protein